MTSQLKETKQQNNSSAIPSKHGMKFLKQYPRASKVTLIILGVMVAFITTITMTSVGIKAGQVNASSEVISQAVVIVDEWSESFDSLGENKLYLGADNGVNATNSIALNSLQNNLNRVVVHKGETLTLDGVVLSLSRDKSYTFTSANGFLLYDSKNPDLNPEIPLKELAKS